MAASSQELHEPVERLTPETVDRHRAIVSLMEELEAVDWYEQRIEGADDPGLAAILRHNSDEEKEHAVMVLEWLRRRDAVLDHNLRRFLFTEGDIAAPPAEADPAPPSSSTGARSLGIGGLRDKENL
jgi:ferritin-like protein